MILAAFEALYDRMPPAWLRVCEASELVRVFARAFDVEPPKMSGRGADEALWVFREFTAACMEAALVDAAVATRYRERLGVGAFELGRMVRSLLRVRPSNAFRVLRYFYRGIGIELSGEVPGDVRFGPCAFAGRYTPGDCWLMSAFDEGFMRGLSGCDQASLEFACRLTQGAGCCRARFS